MSEAISVNIEDLNLAAKKFTDAHGILVAEIGQEALTAVANLLPCVGLIGFDYLARVLKVQSIHLHNYVRLANEYANISTRFKETAAAYQSTDQSLAQSL